ncbi:MAG TPA: hypothetical protein VE621_05380 [Bryobacteraceae bacterium]|jgi:hypothetical protein|nr:hypothetical protein [Bryobacteraceae bacterium]
MTPLSYSLPGFGLRAFEGVDASLEELRSLGFRHVTFTPTFLAVDEVPLRIDLARSPRIDAIARARENAKAMGLMVRMEPHLDWESTLTGGTYEWRRRMYFDPSARYWEALLEPLLGMQPEELTLGSELDAAWVAFYREWQQVRERVQDSGVAAGHKLNHDALEADEELLKLINAERARSGEASWTMQDFGAARVGAAAYLAKLDYVSFSFYPSVEGSAFAREFGRALERLEAGMRAASGFDADLVVGEFGVGSSDMTRPWHFDRSTFFDDGGGLRVDVMEKRRAFYRGWLEALRDTNYRRAACFWTVDQYDFLGIHSHTFADDALREEVRQYNESSS